MGVYLPTAQVRQELLRGRRRLCGPPTPQAPSPQLEVAQALLFGAERPFVAAADIADVRPRARGRCFPCTDAAGPGPGTRSAAAAAAADPDPRGRVTPRPPPPAAASEPLAGVVAAGLPGPGVNGPALPWTPRGPVRVRPRGSEERRRGRGAMRRRAIDQSDWNLSDVSAGGDLIGGSRSGSNRRACARSGASGGL